MPACDPKGCFKEVQNPECVAAEGTAEEEKESVLDSLSAGNAEMLDSIKGMTLVEAAALMKEIESTFNVGAGASSASSSSSAPAEE